MNEEVIFIPFGYDNPNLIKYALSKVETQLSNSILAGNIMM